MHQQGTEWWYQRSYPLVLPQTSTKVNLHQTKEITEEEGVVKWKETGEQDAEGGAEC